MTFNWRFSPDDMPYLETPVGVYMVKKEGYRSYRVFLNFTKTSFFSNSVAGAKAMVERSLTARELLKPVRFFHT